MSMNYAQENARLLKEMSRPGHILVNEVYGPTLQGEGPSLGHPCVFLRLATCNQHCSWCDTKFTWQWDQWDPSKEAHSVAYDDLYVMLRQHGLAKAGRVVISGGEPMLQWRRLGEMFQTWGSHLIDFVEIETAGTIAPNPVPVGDLARKVRFRVSPKLENSGNPLAQRYRPKALKALKDAGAIFKFVVCDPGDFDEIDRIVADVGIAPYMVYAMPEGVTAADIQAHARMVADEVIKRGWNLTTRLQVELWGNKRGV